MRRRWGTRGVGAVLAAVLIATGLAGAAPAGAAGANAAGAPANWAQDGYGPGNTGYNPAESVVNARTIGSVRRRWTAAPAPGSEGCGQPAVPPLVVGNRVFVLDSTGVGAYDAATGKRLWLHTAGYLEGTGLAVVGGLVVVTDVNCFSNSNYSSNVIALDAATGAERWNELTNWSTREFVADAGVVVVGGYCGVCSDAEYGVDAFRAADGARLWSRANAMLAGPVSAGGRILLADPGRHRSTAVAIRTGATLWTVNSRLTARAANPAGDTFYLSNVAGLRAVRAATGTVRWSVPKANGALAADGRRVYLAAAARVTAYDALTGHAEWARALAGPGRPIRAGGLLYTVTKDGGLAILAPATGKPVAAAGGYTGHTDHVVVAGGALYVTRGWSLRAYRP